ncbi:hypothetical protein ACROYT_G009764 [Oculina patagonica]
MIINITKSTLPVVNATQQTFVSRTTTAKQEKINSSNTTRSDSCRCWCRIKAENSSKPYFLTAVLLVRIYVSDLAQLTTREMRQWLYYLRYAGFEHVYVYDAFVSTKNESQVRALKPLIDEGFVTYVDWSHRAFPYGEPLDSNEHPLLIDRLWRRTHGPANALVKPIYKPSHVKRAVVHHNALSKGRSMNFPVDLLRLNHYWGARLQNWEEDTPEIIAKTEPDNSMEPIVKTLQKCISSCLPSVDFVYHKLWN